MELEVLWREVAFGRATDLHSVSEDAMRGMTLRALALNKGAAKQALEVLQTGLVRCSQTPCDTRHLIPRCYSAGCRLGLPNRISTPTMGP